MHDVHTGVSRRFGFVRFAETRAANAVKALNVVHFTDGTPWRLATCRARR